MPTSTAYRWINKGNIADSRGGRRFNLVREEHLNFMIEQIENNRLITLQELEIALNARFYLHLSKTTIWRHLDCKDYSLKHVRFEPERANIPKNKIRREEFVEKLLSYQSRNMPICFMDESNFNVHISRSLGRSVKGTRCTTIAAGSKEQTFM